MCFPSKRQKDNFTDESTKKSINQKGLDEKDIKEPTAPSTAPELPAPTEMSPRIAIVIYTMYQHVGNSTLILVLCAVPHLLSVQWPRLSNKVLRALAAKHKFSSE